LPGLGDDKPEPEAAKDTGTYDARPDGPISAVGKRAAHAQRAGAPKGDFMRLHATEQEEGAKALEKRGKPCY